MGDIWETVCPAKAGMFSRSQSRRGKSQNPRSFDRIGEDNGTDEAETIGVAAPSISSLQPIPRTIYQKPVNAAEWRIPGIDSCPGKPENRSEGP